MFGAHFTYPMYKLSKITFAISNVYTCVHIVLENSVRYKRERQSKKRCKDEFFECKFSIWKRVSSYERKKWRWVLNTGKIQREIKSKVTRKRKIKKKTPNPQTISISQKINIIYNIQGKQIVVTRNSIWM